MVNPGTATKDLRGDRKDGTWIPGRAGYHNRQPMAMQGDREEYLAAGMINDVNQQSGVDAPVPALNHVRARHAR